jgi:hypothetical protein
MIVRFRAVIFSISLCAFVPSCLCAFAPLRLRAFALILFFFFFFDCPYGRGAAHRFPPGCGRKHVIDLAAQQAIIRPGIEKRIMGVLVTPHFF